MRAPARAITPLALLALSLASLGHPLEDGPTRPNIVLIMGDQHRGDAIAADGNTAIRTPHLDRLAREGCLFRRAYSSTPSCTPARAALLTGMSPWGHGMLGYHRIAEEYPVELPRLLVDAGYHAHAIGKNHFHPQRHTHGYHAIELDESGRAEPGFVSDYRQWFRVVAPERDPDATGIGWNDYRARPYQLPEELHPTTWTGDRAVSFIEGYERDEPFLLKVSFARPHSPYDPPQRVLDLYADSTPPAASIGAWSEMANGSFHRPEAHTAARNNLGPDVVRASRTAYYASVTFVDEQIGRILAALERTERLDDTVILYTSDHGDMLGDHHLWRKTFAYEGSARIPMLLYWGDNVSDAARGQTRSEPVELRDVLPTFLDAAEIAVPEAVEGASLFDLVRGGDEGWREVLDLEHATCYWPGNVWTALTDGRTKYVYFARDGREQLFDLDADPGETRDLAPEPEHAVRLAAWRARMTAHLAPRGEPWVKDGELGIREETILTGPNYPRKPRRPNVVLVMTDDQGFGDFGFHGNPLVATPNLDAMARRSARMENFYVSPVCAPTRAALMTGRYCQRTRAIDTYIGRAMMEPAEVTVAEVLRDAGWATGIFGKWHLGDCYPMRAMDQGFDESLVHRGGGIGQPSDPLGAERRYTNPVLFRNGVEVRTEGYCTDVYFDAALAWMRAQNEQRRPFFAYVATNAPHGPFHDVPEDLLAEYRAKDLSRPVPSNAGHALPEKRDEDRLARIFAMITNVDQNVGRLFAELEDMGALENTLVLFLVDNGPNSRRYVAGMRGMKSEVYEGGVRSPLFAHWPARLAADTTSDRVAAHVDVMPTILAACGVAPPEGVTLDGRSLLPLLEGEDTDWPERTITIQSHRGNVAVRYHNFMARSQRWKLVNASGFGKELAAVEPSFELYDMLADPLETANVARGNPDVVTRMRADYDAWFDDVGATRPDNYAPPRIHLGSDAAPEVVLTRQDWRRTSADGGWGGHSRGRWEVLVTHEGPFDVRVRFLAGQAVRRATLRIGGREWSSDVSAESREHTFEKVGMDTGPASLQVDLETGEELVGAYQVFVRRIP